MTKFWTILLMAALLLGMLAGCTAPQPAPTEPVTQPPTVETEPPVTQPPHEPVTIRWWAYEDPVTTPLFLQWLDRLKQAYPWLTVEMTWLDTQWGSQKVTAALENGEQPEILWDTYDNLMPILRQGKAASLESVLTAEPDSPETERIYSLTTDVSAGAAIVCNMAMARELGIEELLPADGISWSYEDFLACLRKAKAAGKYGIGLYAGSAEDDFWYYSWLLGADVKILDIKKGALLANSTKYRINARKVLTLFQTILDEELCSDGAEYLTATDAKAIWYTGESLFAQATTCDTAMLQALYQNGTSCVSEFALFAQPTFDGRKGGGDCTGTGSRGIVAFDTGNEAKLEATYTAIAYLFSEEGGYFQAVSQYKPQLASRQDLTQLDETVAEMYLRFENYEIEHCRSDWGCEEVWFEAFRQSLIPHLSDFFDGDITAKKMLTRWESSAKKAIAGYKAAH